MTSKLAKSTIEKWQSEGLNPTFDDIVKLNALGVKVERSGNAVNFGAVPRIAFLGDWMIKEPTVGKRIWMDEAEKAMPQDFNSLMYFTAWALNCPDDELPKMTNTKVILKEVKKFAELALLDHTTNEILAAIDYALNGNDETSGEEMEIEKQKVETPPAEGTSYALSLFHQALGLGAPAEIKSELTISQLEHMIVCMVMSKGVDVLKDIKTEAAGHFYVAVGKIHERLLREKENGKQ